MVTYAPHFISTVVLVGMMMVFMSQNGIFNQVLGKVGAQPVPFLTDAGLFRHIYVWSHIWQRTGYNSVIYIAALAGVSRSCMRPPLWMERINSIAFGTLTCLPSCPRQLFC